MLPGTKNSTYCSRDRFENLQWSIKHIFAFVRYRVKIVPILGLTLGPSELDPSQKAAASPLFLVLAVEQHQSGHFSLYVLFQNPYDCFVMMLESMFHQAICHYQNDRHRHPFVERFCLKKLKNYFKHLFFGLNKGQVPSGRTCEWNWNCGLTLHFHLSQVT